VTVRIFFLAAANFWVAVGEVTWNGESLQQKMSFFVANPVASLQAAMLGKWPS
jgi:hypothetical protein